MRVRRLRVLPLGLPFSVMRSLLFFAVLLTFSRARLLKKLTAQDVTAALNEFVRLDENGAIENDIQMDYQNMASETNFKDNAPNPLFKSVNSLLTAEATYITFKQLFENYTYHDADVSDPNYGTRSAAINAFIDAIIPTKVMQAAYEILSKAGLMSYNPDTFKTQLYHMWFDPFARGFNKGSSSFESVFVGETQDGEVIGMSNWYGYYLHEKANEVNYHGWYTRQVGVQMELQFAWGDNQAMFDSFLIGTSPEFEIAAYTLCALSRLELCTYTNGDYGVGLSVKTLTTEGVMKIDSAYPMDVLKTTTAPPATTTKPGDGYFQTLVDVMREADVDKPTDYLLNWGNKVSGTSDMSPNPLYTYCNETSFTRPVYKTLIDIYNNNVFTPDVCTAESANSGTKKAYLDAAFKALTDSTLFELAFEFLHSFEYAGNRTDFMSQLYTLWFGTYSRCNGPLGSSGFEHVFVGEYKDDTVDGQHNWVKYYLEEKAGRIDYHGYDSYDEQLTGTFQYTWNDYLKNVGGFNLGTSPAFDFSLYTVCALARPGARACHFTIDNFPIWVTSYTQACADGVCLSTAYPSDS